MKFDVRQNLENEKYYLYCEDSDGEQFDIWQFTSKDIALKVRDLVDEDKNGINELNEIIGDVWNLADINSVVCVLTNDSVCKYFDQIYMQDNIYNPMGAGIAGEAKQRNPEFPKAVAKAILGEYRECGVDKETDATLYRFSTKRSIQDPYSDLQLIEQSLNDLADYCERNEDMKIYLPRPGCGIGGLNWEKEVKPLVQKYLGKYKNVYIVSK